MRTNADGQFTLSVIVKLFAQKSIILATAYKMYTKQSQHSVFYIKQYLLDERQMINNYAIKLGLSLS